MAGTKNFFDFPKKYKGQLKMATNIFQAQEY